MFFLFSELINNEKIEMLSPLVLAFVGDTVYDLYVRTRLVSQTNAGVDKLHKNATSYVNCSAQSQSIKKIEPFLTESERAVFKRGRNSKSHTPKNAEMADYKNATGFEALIGYIYLKGDNKRLKEIMDMVWDESLMV